MLQTKQITLHDGNLDKNFTIKKLSVISLLFLSEKILSVNPDDPENIVFLKQYLDLSIKNGHLPKITDIELKDELNKLDHIDLLVQLVKKNFASNDKSKDILNTIINTITLNNGTLNVELNMLEKSPNNINIYISELASIYKLIYEVIKYNYEDFFLEAKETNL